MFVETEARPAGEPAKVGTLKLSEAIRMGKPIVGTEAIDFKFCALGCAWAGINGRRMTGIDLAEMSGRFPDAEWPERFAIALGFDPATCKRVSTMHSLGTSAMKIADRLEREGK